MSRHAAPRPERRRRPLVIAAVAVLVVALVAVASVLLLGGGDSSGSTGSPADTALAWGKAAVKQDDAARKKLECSQGSHAYELFGITSSGATGVTAGATNELSPGHWEVTLHLTQDAKPPSEFPTPVIQEKGKYLVC